MLKKDIHTKEQLPVVTGEYLFYKGIIRGLEEALGKTPKEVSALKNIYRVKTIEIDRLIGDEE